MTLHHYSHQINEKKKKGKKRLLQQLLTIFVCGFLDFSCKNYKLFLSDAIKSLCNNFFTFEKRTERKIFGTWPEQISIIFQKP